MTQADIQLCSLEGELQTFLLKHTLHPALANVLVEAAAFAFNKRRSLVDAIALTEHIYTVLRLTVPTRSAFDTTSHQEEHLSLP